jgi:hypothetical protein
MLVEVATGTRTWNMVGQIFYNHYFEQVCHAQSQFDDWEEFGGEGAPEFLGSKSLGEYFKKMESDYLEKFREFSLNTSEPRHLLWLQDDTKDNLHKYWKERFEVECYKRFDKDEKSQYIYSVYFLIRQGLINSGFTQVQIEEKMKDLF